LSKVDYIIVGQGIAGSFLSWFFLRQEKTFIAIDEANDSSASTVAAGIIHPVTGRRIVKSWMADTLITFAERTYTDIEKYSGREIFHPLRIVELLASPKEYNDWMSRSAEQDLSEYVDGTDPGTRLDKYLHPFFKKITIKKSSRIDIGVLLEVIRTKLLAEKILRREKYDGAFLSLTKDGINYKDVAASKIIFCEGAQAVVNPYWKHLPFMPAKGEVITVEANMDLDCVLNRKIFILPAGKNTFRVGSTYSWKFENDLPTEAAKDYLIAELGAVLKIPFKVVAHQAAIRPTVRNRRPLLGLHPVHRQIGIFNGLGTKGCLLAPYFANHLTEFLAGKNELMKEVDAGLVNPARD
jgi:glycine oxidase